MELSSFVFPYSGGVAMAAERSWHYSKKHRTSQVDMFSSIVQKKKGMCTSVTCVVELGEKKQIQRSETCNSHDDVKSAMFVLDARVGSISWNAA